MRILHIVLAAPMLAACGDPDVRPGKPSSHTSTGAPIPAASASAGASASPTASRVGDDHAGFVVTDLAPAEPKPGTSPPPKLTDALATYYDLANGVGLKLYVELGAEWCGPCVALKKSLPDPRMQRALKGTYIVRLDIDAWGDRLEKSGYSTGAIPAFYEVDKEGKPTGRKIDGGAWGENVPENMAPPLDHFFHG